MSSPWLYPRQFYFMMRHGWLFCLPFKEWSIFYHNLKEMFKPWRYQYKGLTSYTAKTISGADSGQGEELVEVIPHEEKTTETIGTFNRGDAKASFETYLRTDDPTLFNEIAQTLTGHRTGTNDTPRDQGYRP